MFIILKYGDSQENIFNSYCKVNNLLKSIRKKCILESPSASEILAGDAFFDIDLVDLGGNPKRLYLSQNQTAYANTFLKEREVLILYKLEKNELGKVTNYLPLLKDSKILNEEFQVKFNKKESTGKKDSVSSTSGTRQRSLSTKSQSGSNVQSSQMRANTNIIEEQELHGSEVFESAPTPATPATQKQGKRNKSNK